MDADEPGEAILTRWRSADGLVDQITACRRSQVAGAIAADLHRHPSRAYEAFKAAIASVRPA